MCNRNFPSQYKNHFRGLSGHTTGSFNTTPRGDVSIDSPAAANRSLLASIASQAANKCGFILLTHSSAAYAATRCAGSCRLAVAFRLASACASVVVKSINPRAYKSSQKLMDFQE